MSFQSMCKETIEIENSEGRNVGSYKCTLAKGQATIFEENIDVEEGYSILHVLPGGKKAQYLVTEANFHSKFGTIPAHWTLSVEKSSSLKGKAGASSGQTINITGSSAFQIGNQNSMQISDAFKSLIENIDKSDASEEEKKEAKGLLAKAVEHPLVSAVLGGLAQGVVAAITG